MDMMYSLGVAACIVLVMLIAMIKMRQGEKKSRRIEINEIDV